MKKRIGVIFLIFISGTLFAKDINPNHKILIAYFTLAQNLNIDLDTFPGNVDASTHASVKAVAGTYKGDTEIVAEWIQKRVGGDLFSVITTITYPNNFDQTVEQNENEIDENLRPVLISHLSNISEYDIVFLGYPVWYRDIPLALYSFLEKYDLSGKTIIPFTLHMGGGLGKSVNTIQRLEPDAEVRKPLVISDYRILDSEKEVDEWLPEVDFR